FATYTLLSERAGASYGVLGALLRGFCAASLMWIVFQATRGWPTDLVKPDNLIGVLFVGIAGTFMPFILFLWGVQQVRAERAAIAATSEPIIAAVIAWVWLGQSLSMTQVIGGAVTVAGVVTLQVRRREVAVPEL
ncbi:MAG: DMT family transporter, partial [Actinobacteria bacterium]|nr:DMT family transporter [Actinomycetota bacterium]